MVEDDVNVAISTAVEKISVFLAWSGTVSQKMAELLKEQLPLFVRNIDIFMSEDITKGKRWHAEIANALGSTKFGVLCLTPENLTSEWIHFEAGALSKTVDESTHVCPLLLDVKKSELKEPLASFHATLFDKKEFKKLVNDLAKACGDSLGEGQIGTLLDALWPKINEHIEGFKAELAEARQKSGEPEEAETKADPVLEEILVRVRDQGRFMAKLAEMSGADLVKELKEDVHSIKMGQQYIMHGLRRDYKQTILKDREEDGPARAYFTASTRGRRIDVFLRGLPIKLTAKTDPENLFNLLLKKGLLTKSQIQTFGGIRSTIDAIGVWLDCNANRLTEEEET